MSYDSNVVITYYGQVIEDRKLSDQDLTHPTKEWLGEWQYEQTKRTSQLYQ